MCRVSSLRKSAVDSSRFTLFGTAGCHLCETAHELISLVVSPADAGLLVRIVDIADDPELSERYGIRIPVLVRHDPAAELDWPFDLETLRAWIADG